MQKDVGAMLSQLSGYDRPSEDKAITALIHNADDDLVIRLEAELAKSKWPLCVSLAKALARIGTDRAKAALVTNLATRNKHVRSAAINGLVITGDTALVDHIEPFLADAAFASRIAAKEAIRALTGRDVKTSHGE